jgi:hypothetical protein
MREAVALTSSPCHPLAVVSLVRRGAKYIELPYVVKGMDVSFSGVLSMIEKEAKCVRSVAAHAGWEGGGLSSTRDVLAPCVPCAWPQEQGCLRRVYQRGPVLLPAGDRVCDAGEDFAVPAARVAVCGHTVAHSVSHAGRPTTTPYPPRRPPD